MAFPWLAAAIGIPALLNLFKGGGGRQQTVRETEVPPRGYQSPMVGMLDPLLIDMLLRNIRTWGGYGQGGRTGGSYSPYVDQIINMLGTKTFPKLFQGYGR